jgi:hypothetical protein
MRSCVECCLIHRRLDYTVPRSPLRLTVISSRARRSLAETPCGESRCISSRIHRPCAPFWSSGGPGSCLSTTDDGVAGFRVGKGAAKYRTQWLGGNGGTRSHRRQDLERNGGLVMHNALFPASLPGSYHFEYGVIVFVRRCGRPVDAHSRVPVTSSCCGRFPGNPW